VIPCIVAYPISLPLLYCYLAYLFFKKEEKAYIMGRNGNRSRKDVTDLTPTPA
jgi:hypothetical protein